MMSACVNGTFYEDTSPEVPILVNGSLQYHNIMDNRTRGSATDVILLRVVVNCAVALIEVSTIALNMLILLAFFKDRRIRTPFNLLLLNVTVSDLLAAVFSMTGYVSYGFNGEAWALGSGYCSVHLYFDWTATAAGILSVTLVSLDRVWALYWPFNYRTYRSKTVSGLACLTMWLYANIVVVPMVVMDSVWYRFTETSICMINTYAQKYYASITIILCFAVPLLVTIVCYGLIVARRSQRSRLSLWRRNHRVHLALNADVPSGHSSVLPVYRLSPRELALLVRSEKDELRLNTAIALLISMTILMWTPITVMAMWTVFSPKALENPQFGRYYSVALLLQYLSCLVNPVVYHRTLPDVREAIWSLFQWKRATG